MERKRIVLDEIQLPAEIRALAEGSDLYDSSCSPEARVYLIDRDGGYYLKKAPHGALEKEALMDAYFHSKGLGAEVVSYLSGDFDWLLTRRVRGEDCTHAQYLADGLRLAHLLGERLRMLHDADASNCPVQNRMASYFALAEKNAARGEYDLSFAKSYGISNAQEAWKCVEAGRAYLKNDTLLHGDYCLPNVILEDWHFSGFIDLGNGGVGDRHVDLFWGAWTLEFNLKTDRYRNAFFEAYGKDLVEEDALRVIAAAEVFG